MNRRYATPYGAYRALAAPMANTRVCANASQPLPVTSTAIRTTEVTTAANRGPRGSRVIGAASLRR